MRKKILAVVMSVAMAVGMMATGTVAKAADSLLPLVGEWTGFSNGVESKEPVTFNFTDANDGSDDWEKCISTAATWEEGATYQVTLDVESTIARKINVGPETMTRSRYEETLIDIPAGQSVVTNRFVIPSNASPSLFIFLGRKVQTQDVYMYEEGSGDQTVVINSVEVIKVTADYVLANDTDDEIVEYFTLDNSYASSLLNQLVELEGDGFKGAVAAELKAQGAANADAVKAIYAVAAKKNVPVPQGVGYQTKAGTAGCEDMRFVFSVAENSKYNVKEVGAIAINPYWVGGACGSSKLDDVRSNMTIDNTTNLVKGGAVTDLFTQVTDVAANATAGDNVLYITLKAENLAGNVADQDLPARAYVTLETENGDVTIYSDVCYGRTVASAAE